MKYVGLSCLFSFCLLSQVKCEKVIELDFSDWTRMLDGDWLVLYYAPWCPACKMVKPDWANLARTFNSIDASDENTKPIRIAQVDATANPALSGILFINALPTIYRVKNGEFQRFIGTRSFSALAEFVRTGKGKTEAPLSWYFSPAYFHMRMLAQFIRISLNLEKLHSHLVVKYGIPSIASYIIMVIAVVFVGVSISLFSIWLFDMIIPPRPQLGHFVGENPQRSVGEKPEGSAKEEEDVSDAHKYSIKRGDEQMSTKNLQQNVGDEEDVLKSTARQLDEDADADVDAVKLEKCKNRKIHEEKEEITTAEESDDFELIQRIPPSSTTY